MGSMVLVDPNLEDCHAVYKQLEDQYYDLIVTDRDAEAEKVKLKMKFYSELIKAGIDYRPKF